MTILHVAAITNDPFNGVCVSVPHHILSQSSFSNIVFLNIANERIAALENCVNQLQYDKSFDLKKFTDPFDKIDLVVFHECYRVEYLHLYRLFLAERIPYIIIPHGELREEAQQKKHLKKTLANILLFNRFIDNACGIQCLSQEELDATHFGKTKFIGTNGIYMPSRFKCGFNNDSIKFTYIGRYEWYVKGLDLLFDAIVSKKELLKKRKCHFDLYGPDIHGRFDTVNSMIEDKMITDLVSLHHEIRGLEKEQVLLNTDIFIQTSRHEGMPMGILEALSYGLPCLITKGTSLGDVVSKFNAGWVACTSVESIGQMLELATNDNLYIKSQNAIQSVKPFIWDNISQNTINQYKYLLNKSNYE